MYKVQIKQVLLTAIGIVLNLILAKVAVVFSLPVYLDSVATIISVALLPWYFSVTIAIVTSLVGSMVVDPNLIFYCATHVTISLAAIFCFRIGLLNSWPEALLSGLVIAISAVIVSAPVTVLVFEGITWSESTVITNILLDSGKSLWQSVLQGAILIEAVDKIGAALLAFLLHKQFPQEHAEK